MGSDSVDSEGKAGHFEYTAKLDGKDFPVTGSPRTDSISIRKVDENTFDRQLSHTAVYVRQ